MSRTTTQPELIPENVGKLIPRPIADEVQESYLDYAMSVIVGRALPDVRDGLKPVHRRVLYAMWNIGLKPAARFKKSAFVVGEVMAKYHPHGDTAIYDTLVRMAQDFAMRHMLVNGQGNFGSMDGDAAAAMRYTECKLAAIAEPMMVDIEKETVPFVSNYDGSTKEPAVLPARFPNLLLNGQVGIAVGMATSIPPHNLRELADAVLHLMDKPDSTVEDLMEFVKGPDFPTGGIIYNKKDILQAYATGRGGIVMRAKTEIVEEKNGMFRIIVTEMPYAVNKATMLEKIADLVTEKKIEGIKDLRDESSKDGVRIVIELRKDAYPKKVLNKLFLMTQLEEKFHVNMLALVDGVQPRVLNLKSVLEYFVAHRKDVVRKRTEFDLAKAKARAHILEGLKIALDNLDAVIKVIRTSYDRDEAKTNLMTKFKLSELQANAILDMRLSQLANLERQKVEDELAAILKLIAELEGILKSPAKIIAIIAKEMTEIREKYGEDRRTQIVAHGLKEFSAEDLIPNEPTIVLITADGYIKRLPPDTFRTQGRGGKGVSGLKTKEDDVIEHVFSTNTHADLLFFTSRGRAFQLKAYDVPPAASRTSKGQALVNFLQLGQGEKVTTVLSSDDLSGYKYLFMTTRDGVVKKSELKDFVNVRRSGLISITLAPEDALTWVRPTTGNDDISLVSADGQSIRFSEEDVRPMGRQAAGVIGMRLKGKDKVVGMDVIETDSKKGLFELLVVTARGYGKRTKLNEYKVQGRGGSGIITANVTEKTGPVTIAMVVHAKDTRDLLVVSQQAQVIRLPVNEISVLSRDTQGVRVMRFKEANDAIASVTLVDPSTATDEEGAE